MRAPLLGEHTEEILRTVLAYDEAEIAEIEASGAIGEVRREAAE
jgi:formyl-CoA transferase